MSTQVNPQVSHSAIGAALRHGNNVWPGVLLAAIVTAAGFALRSIPGFALLSPMILAILIGMVFHNVIGTPQIARDGVRFCMRRILRAAIVLLGLQLTAAQIAEVGGSGIAIIAATLLATFVFTSWLGRALGIDRKLAQLIAAGTSVCGASAVIATNTVTRANDEDVAYAVACVTVFGSISMFLYPLVPGLLHLDPHVYGLWTGASIHEIAQVVAAAFQNGQAAGEFGTIAKLSRVMMLAPLVMALGWLAVRGQSGRRPGGKAAAPFPWFVLGFIAMVALNSLIPIPAVIKSGLVTLTVFLLSLALAAMGLETDIAKLRARGLRPLLVGAFSWVFISGFSLALIVLFF